MLKDAFLMVFAAITCLGHGVRGKHSSGDFRLSGANTEHLIAAFSFGPEGGVLSLSLTATQVYDDTRSLNIAIYRDTEWSKVKQAQTCREKIKHSRRQEGVEFLQTRNSQDISSAKFLWNANAQIQVDGDSSRAHYWYVMVSDCMLEEVFRDDRVPVLHFEIDLLNYASIAKHADSKRTSTHLSADELNLRLIHTVAMILSGIVSLVLLLSAILTVTNADTSINDMNSFPGKGKDRPKKPNNKPGTVHVIVIWVALAAALDAGSSFFELVHLRLYHLNGIGSYVIDAMSAHLEAMCDATLILLLISVGAGWTIPGDVLPVGDSALTTSWVQRAIREMRQPLIGLLKLNSAGATGFGILLFHAALAQWGRVFNDDCESYHDYGHWPGRLLMIVRSLLGIVFWGATLQTRERCRMRPLKSFYAWLAVFGGFWFHTLPFLVLVCHLGSVVPHYLQHTTIYTGSAVLQCSSLLALSWLVAGHETTYYRVSSMSTHTECLSQGATNFDEANPLKGDQESVSFKSFPIRSGKIRLD